MKAGIVAAELRKLADSLDVQPDAEIIKPGVYFFGYGKEEFLSTVKLLPRPLVKKVATESITVNCSEMVISVHVLAPQSQVCELVEPAVYLCEPLLSKEEEEKVTE